MLVLLDENLLSRKLKQPLMAAGHTVSNVDGLARLQRPPDSRDGSDPFDLFITADKNLPFQQNLSAYDIRILVLDVSSTKPSHLLPLIIQLSSQLLALFEAGKAFKINDAGEINLIVR